MKKVILSILIIFLIFGCNKEKEINKEENNKRYNEIKESIKKAVEWQISAQYPSCTNKGIYSDELNVSSGKHENSSFLINNGYIKMDELLDVDNKSYCDTYVVIKSEYQDEYDHQNNCNIYYKFFLKCKDYEEKGYMNWEK